MFFIMGTVSTWCVCVGLRMKIRKLYILILFLVLTLFGILARSCFIALQHLRCV